MVKSLTDGSLGQLFSEARTHAAWLSEDVSDAVLKRLVDLVKMAPTSINSSPARFVFVKSAAAKEKLKPHLSAGNVAKAMAAPVTAIIATDYQFYEHLPTLFPHGDKRSSFVDNTAYAQETAFRNSSLQGGYFILAARSLGLDCGPMSGFDHDGVDQAFFLGSAMKANFLCNIGYGDHSKLHPRLPRLSFDQMAQIV